MPTAKYSVKCPYTMVPTRIVVHNTANDASAENEIKYMQSNDNQVSFHYAVDDKEAVLGVPLNRNAWHAGDGGNGVGNRQGIAVEICYSKSGGTKFSKAEENSALLIAGLLKERGWGIDKVTKHQDYSGKYCPHRTLDLGWERFLGMVQSNMGTQTKTDYPDTYTHDGLTFVRCRNFAVRYHDAAKKTARFPGFGEASGGFFATFKSSAGETFTLPVANLTCDIDDIPDAAFKYLANYVSGGKLRYGCNNNQTAQFKGKKVSTLVVPASGAPYVADIAVPPIDCKYAISGVPTVRNGDDVDYYNYVKPQGWDDSCMRAAYRHWLGVRNGEIWLITGKTSANNYIYGMEFWKKVRGEGFDDIICIDGGGSYYYKPKSGTVKATLENRRINNKVRV